MPGFFLCIFSSLTYLKKPVFSKRDLLRWKVQPGCTGIFCPAEGTSQPITISTKWKNPSNALPRKKTWVQALPWFWTCSLSLPALDTDLKSWKGVNSGPSPIYKVPSTFWDWFQFYKARKRGKESVSPRKTVMLHTLLLEGRWVYLAQPLKCDVHRDKTKIIIIIHRLFVVVVDSPPDCSFLAASSNLTHRFEHCLASQLDSSLLTKNQTI